MVGIPTGIGQLLTPATRVRLGISLAGSVLLAILDMLGVLAMLPMMQLISGADLDGGALGWIRGLLGDPDQESLVLVLASGIVGAFAVKDVIAMFFRIWQLRFMADQEVATSTRVLQGYLTGPYAWHLVRNTGDKAWTVDGAVMIGFSTGIAAALSLAAELMTIVLIFGSLLVVSTVPTLVAILYFGTAGLLLQLLIRRRVAAAGDRNVEASRTTGSTVIQALGAAKEIKLRRAEERFVTRYRSARHVAAHSRAIATFLGELPKYLLEMVFVIGIALLAYGVSRVGSAQDGIVVLGLFVAAGSRILPSTVRLIGAVNGLRFAKPPLEHLLREVSQLELARQDEDDRVTTTQVPDGDIAIRGLTFAYDDRPDVEVLTGVDLDIRANASVAVVGSSGAGKSTLVDLLLGLHRPASGTVTAGGTDIYSNLPGWQRGLAVVPQEVYLLDESLTDNIVFDEEVDADRLADALRRAQLDDLVAGLPDGLETVVGERGARLSGGQRQRIGIARALYRKPRLLVLDEATSALDNETERRLTDTIEDLRGQMTMLIVAHRLSTVRHCDLLVFMSEGRIAAVGTFDEVRRKSAEFAHLVELGSLRTTDDLDELQDVTR